MSQVRTDPCELQRIAAKKWLRVAFERDFPVLISAAAISEQCAAQRRSAEAYADARRAAGVD